MSRTPRAVRTALAAAVVFACVAASASGSTVSQSDTTITYTAAPGEANALRINNGLVPNTTLPSIRVSDGEAIVQPGNCLRELIFFPNLHAAHCLPPKLTFSVKLGDGDDDADVNVGGTTERTTMRGDDGNDTLKGADGADTFFGGSGNDTINGDDGRDVLSGEDGGDSLNGEGGNDDLFGLGGADFLQGGSGDDRLFARDGVAELFTCGAGSADFADIDLKDVFIFGFGTSVTDCESVSQGAVKETPNVRIVGPAVLREGAIRVRLSCPRKTGGCRGSLTAQGLRGRRGTRIGSTRYSAIAAGRARLVRVPVEAHRAARLRRVRVFSVETGKRGPKRTLDTLALRRTP